MAVAYMKIRLKSYKTLMFEGEFLHLRCACHIINLIIKYVIKELKGGIVGIWNYVKCIGNSSQRLNKFIEFFVLEHMMANVNVPLDVITRWNNTYLMLEVAQKYKLVRIWENGLWGLPVSSLLSYFKEHRRVNHQLMKTRGMHKYSQSFWRGLMMLLLV